MTDKELLEAAAKAGGYTVHGWIGPRFFVRDFNHPHDTDPRPFDPLNDDGDALRLAVKLEMNAEYNSGWGAARAITNAGSESARESWADSKPVESWNGYNAHDPFSAIRRAIVRAAAATLANK